MELFAQESGVLFRNMDFSKIAYMIIMPSTCIIGLVGYVLLFKQVSYANPLTIEHTMHNQMLTESRVIHGRLRVHVMALSIYDFLLIVSSFLAFSELI